MVNANGQQGLTSLNQHGQIAVANFFSKQLTSAPAGHSSITPMTLDFGSVALGQSKTASFTIANTGGSPITLNKAAPPAGEFAAVSPVGEGTIIEPGKSIAQAVTFAPTVAGATSGQYQITADDGQGIQVVGLSGTGTGTTIPDPTAGGWQLNGAASITGGALQLNPATKFVAGSAFWPAAVPSSSLTINYDALIGNGSGPTAWPWP